MIQSGFDQGKACLLYTSFPNKVFKTVIPRNVRLSEAPSFGQPIIYFDRVSKGAQAYNELAQEIIGMYHM